MLRTLIISTLFLTIAPALADAPVIEQVTAQSNGSTWTFSVTLSHPDTGWDHYADGWQVLAPDGSGLGVRVLAHPHVNEQPFTRSLGSVEIPDGITFVSIQARDNIGGWFDDLFRVELSE